MTINDLRFGYRRAEVPEGTEAVWGARWIFPDDQLWDRQDAVGKAEAVTALIDWLNSTAGDAARAEARRLAETYELSRGDDREVTLYEDDEGKMVGNPNASHGYLYVTAYLKEAT